MPGQARTLIAHADRAALETLRTIAAELSADVHLAGCGRLAEELARSVRPDLVVRTDDIDVAALPPEIRCPAQPRSASAPRLMTLDEIERRAVLEALERANWNKQIAASALGIHRPTLYSKMRKYAIAGSASG